MAKSKFFPLYKPPFADYNKERYCFYVMRRKEIPVVILDEVKRRLSEITPVIADLSDALAIEQSKVRLDELENRSADPAFTAQVVGIERGTDAQGGYFAKYFAKPACEFANFVKHFPTEWILPNYQGITQEAIDYFKPLMAGEPKLVMDGAVPATIVPFNKR